MSEAPARQRGAAAVEFALVVSMLLLLMIGIFELGRYFFTLNSAAEATRRGSRLAATSHRYDGAILADMQIILPGLAAENLRVSYLPSACTAGSCSYVQVAISGYSMTPLLWSLASIAVPPCTTTIPVESLGEI